MFSMNLAWDSECAECSEVPSETQAELKAKIAQYPNYNRWRARMCQEQRAYLLTRPPKSK